MFEPPTPLPPLGTPLVNSNNLLEYTDVINTNPAIWILTCVESLNGIEIHCRATSCIDWYDALQHVPCILTVMKLRIQVMQLKICRPSESIPRTSIRHIIFHASQSLCYTEIPPSSMEPEIRYQVKEIPQFVGLSLATLVLNSFFWAIPRRLNFMF